MSHNILCIVPVCTPHGEAHAVIDHLARAAGASNDSRFDLHFFAFERREDETFDTYRSRLRDLIESELIDIDDDARQGLLRRGISPSRAACSIQALLIAQDIRTSRPDDLSAVELATMVKGLRPLVRPIVMTSVPTAAYACLVDDGAPQRSRRRKPPIECVAIDELEGAMAAQRMIETKIVNPLARRYLAPFWEGVLQFTSRPIITTHAMPFQRGNSAILGGSARDFVDFYGYHALSAEASATLGPLDSPHHATGSLKHAQDAAACAFGADQTRFVTNGTSTANKIILQALLDPGDLVLVDRNCHISHHYGLALADARPWYLEPHHLDSLGISGGVSLRSVAAALDKIICGTGGAQLPRAILLTNCTFDGVMLRPRRLYETVRTTLAKHGLEHRFGEIMFVIDEAWFAFARFHPKFIAYSALSAAAELGVEDPFYDENLRVYVSQSTHKTLTAFRQGSMIHIRDPYLCGSEHPEEASAISRRLDQAYHTHTTTSVSVPHLASLDVGRRQAELEGCLLVQENALRLALQFRKEVEDSERGISIKYPRLGELFGIVSADELIPLGDRADFALDATKVTVRLKQGIPGGELKKQMLDRFDIQFNKNSDNTVLFMFTIGSSDEHLAALLDRLERYACDSGRSLVPLAAPTAKIPTFRGFATRNWVALCDVDPAAAGQFHEIGFFFRGAGHRRVELIDFTEAIRRAEAGRPAVAADFLNPYPPGFPLLVPGQIVDADTARYAMDTSTKEIHGTVLIPGVGLSIPVFRDYDAADTRFVRHLIPEAWTMIDAMEQCGNEIEIPPPGVPLHQAEG